MDFLLVVDDSTDIFENRRIVNNNWKFQFASFTRFAFCLDIFTVHFNKFFGMTLRTLKMYE